MKAEMRRTLRFWGVGQRRPRSLCRMPSRASKPVTGVDTLPHISGYLTSNENAFF